MMKSQSLYSSASSLSSAATAGAGAPTVKKDAGKETFGSRDSLNESAAAVIPAGNVAAYRKSLEKQALDIAGALQPPATATAAAVAAGAAAAIEKPARKSFDTTKGGDFRKSLESLDEKPKVGAATGAAAATAAAASAVSTVPVLTKKPLVPIKKSPTVSSVANSIFSGLKSKVGSGAKEAAGGKGTAAAPTAAPAAAAVDHMDGGASSRMVSCGWMLQWILTTEMELGCSYL